MESRQFKVRAIIAFLIIIAPFFVYIFLLEHVDESDDSLGLPESQRPIHPAVDQILQELKFGNIAFNAPKTMNLRDTALIQLKLNLETPIDKLKQTIEAAGKKIGARIQIADRMEARLIGSNFAITAITSEVQAVPQSDTTEWQWELKPSSDGTHRLHLTLSVLLTH